MHFLANVYIAFGAIERLRTDSGSLGMYVPGRPPRRRTLPPQDWFEVSKTLTPKESPFPCILLNLNRRKDRLERMERTLPAGLCNKTCRFPARDSTLMTTRPFFISEEDWNMSQGRQKNHIRTAGSKLTPGGIALLENSRRIWERIVRRNTTTVVMEDDIAITGDWFGALLDLQHRDDWDFVQLQIASVSGTHRVLKDLNATKPRMKRGLRPQTGMYVITRDRNESK